MISWLIALILNTTPVPPAIHQPYTCYTDYECEQECIGRGGKHCDDMMWLEDEPGAK